MKGTGRGKGWRRAAEEVREKLGRFAGRPRFNQEFEEAFEFFFGESVESLQETLDEADFDRFMEWFLFDYRLANGHRLVEIFDLEHGTDLSRPARRLLRAWQRAYLTLLELQEEEGETYRFLDLLTGSRYELASAAFDEPLAPWSLVIARPLPEGNGAFGISQSITVLPATAKEPLLQLLRGEFRRFRHAHGEARAEHFLREQGYVFNDLLTEIELEWNPGRFEGDEAYRVVSARAVYQVRDPKKVVARLLAYSDIRMGRQGRLIWWEGRKGRAKRVLAEIVLSGHRLQLFCWSRERLEKAKSLLVDRMKGLVAHLVDAFEEPEHPMETPARAAYDDYVDRWVERPLEALYGLSPRELLSKPLGRMRVTELIHQIEHVQELRMRRGWGLKMAAELRARLKLEASPGSALPLGERPSSWNTRAEAEVAEAIERHFTFRGRSREYIDSAVWIWWDFCSRAFPRVRKVEAWVAAVEVCVGYVENWGVTAADAAREHGVTPQTVSRNAARIREILDLDPFDDRYCVEHPVDGLLERLGQIHDAMAEGKDDPTTRSITAAAQVREAVRSFAAKHDHLHDRAESFFVDHVGCSRQEPLFRDGFLDWFHFDWPVPVLGGETLARKALENGDISPQEKRLLREWVGCHPSFYVVEGAAEANGTAPVGRESARGTIRLTLREMVDGSQHVVSWLRLGEVLGPRDVVFARLVPVGEEWISLGQVIAIPARWRESVQKSIEEERSLVNRWNGRYLSWEEFRSRYAERLYAIAYRMAHEVQP